VSFSGRTVVSKTINGGPIPSTPAKIMTKYCVTKTELKDLYLAQVKKNFGKMLSDPKTLLDFKENATESRTIRVFTSKTITGEIFYAIELANIYFDEKINPLICFDMASGFDPSTFKNRLEFSDLERWVETDTWVDCYISHGNEEIKFQIKQFPEKWKKMTTPTFIDYLKDQVSKQYVDMSDVTLVVVPQVKTPHSDLPIDVENVKCSLATEDLKFNRIVLLLNVENKGSRLIVLYEKRGLR
jgi:hypothetical protein